MRGNIFYLVVACVLLLVSCNPYTKQIPTGTPLALKNVYTNPNYNYTQLVNVLLLPVNNPLHNAEIKGYEKKLALSILRNFKQFHYFNIQYADKQEIRKQSVIDLQSEEVNRTLLGALGEEYNAQAILQMSIIDLQVYAPMRLALQAALIDVNSGERIWQAEQVFDSSNAAVYNGMRYWWNTHVAGANEFDHFDFDRLRPNMFFDYVFYTVANTYGASRIQNIKHIAQEEKRQESNAKR